MRVIPAMDLLGGRVVRLLRGRYDAVTVYSEDPAAVLEGFLAAGAEWVHVVDLDGAREGRAVQAAGIARLLARVGTGVGARARVQVGGGIRTLDQVRAYVDAGVARVVLGTRAAGDPGFVAQAAALTGVVAALDAREGRVATEGWTVQTDLAVTDLAAECARHGAQAVLFTDIARDGTREGPAVEATAALARAVPGVEVIASGGVGTLDHLRALARRPEIAGAVVGRALYEGAFTLAAALAAARDPGEVVA